MNYQGLCDQDIRNISCYIKYQFYPKGSYIVRQYDKSTALYGIINGSCEVSLTELTRLKKFRGDTNADKDSSVCPQLKQKTG